MLEYNAVKIRRILNPTSIDLGEYVINPFMGCEFSCLYCYVRSNRVISRKNKPWGEYVDIRVNAPELLEKEIALRKPRTVLLGSTTECFQPIERKYRLTRRILEILNRHKVYYVILTRSPYILDDLALLKEGYCQEIYFTINRFSPEFKSVFEPKSPAFEAREKAIEILLDEGVPVVPYFSPLLPWVFDIKGLFSRFRKAKLIEFECLNFMIVNIGELLKKVSLIDPSLKIKYGRMLNDRIFYERTWQEIEKEIKGEAESSQKEYSIYVHNFRGYFKNTYTYVEGVIQPSSNR